MPHLVQNLYSNILKSNKTEIRNYIISYFFVFTLLAQVGIFLPTPTRALTEIEQINQQIAEINKSISSNLSKKQTAADELAIIDAQANVILLQINSTQMQLDEANAKINLLKDKIDTAEKDLTAQKQMLGEYIRQMYIDGQVSQVQLILTSKNFSDFVDRSQYLNTMQGKVTETVGKIQELMDALTKQKNEVEITKANAESLMASQTAQRNALSAQQAYKNAVIADVDASNDQLADQKNALFAKKARLSAAYGETIGSGSTGYPWGNPVPQSISCNYGTCTHDGMGYYIGQCTSYVAWKRKQIGKPINPAIGNGGQWTGAAAGGYAQDYLPRYGDAMVFPYIGGYGHVAFVEAVNPDGTVYISEYNWTPDSYTVRTVNPASYGAYFIH